MAGNLGIPPKHFFPFFQLSLKRKAFHFFLYVWDRTFPFFSLSLMYPRTRLILFHYSLFRRKKSEQLTLEISEDDAAPRRQVAYPFSVSLTFPFTLIYPSFFFFFFFFFFLFFTFLAELGVSPTLFLSLALLSGIIEAHLHQVST